MTPDTILNFWFTETLPEQRFKKDLVFDELIRSRFESLYEQASKGELAEWRLTPEGRLAEIIVLDQFSRNMYRGTAKAFAADPLALECAQEAVETGDDLKLSPEFRQFLYMPYMHSESATVHIKALELFEKINNKGVLRYEIEHKAIVDRFGRYPSRNEFLNRQSTPEEIEYLKTNKGF